nr:MAG TPA: hypothetical protein [Caudoviricetes sp.]
MQLYKKIPQVLVTPGGYATHKHRLMNSHKLKSQI